MLSREHRLYKAFKQMRDKEKEYQRKRDEMGWRGLDGPFTKEEIELHKEFFEFMKECSNFLYLSAPSIHPSILTYNGTILDALHRGAGLNLLWSILLHRYP